MVVRLDFVARGRASGVETVVRDAGSAYRLTKRGKCVRQDFFMDQGGWEQALDAVGLAPVTL
jgi:hypothetical protein